MISLRSLLHNNHADAKMIGLVVDIFVTLIVSVLVLYNVASSIDYTTANENIAENVYGFTDGATVGDDTNASWAAFNATVPATNGSTDILDQVATFYQIAPIIGIVVVAVVILGYVNKIGG